MKAAANPTTERFLQVTAEILRLTLRLDEVDVEAQTEEAIDRLLDDYARLMAEFQATVLQLFGEKPAVGEDTAEFFGRIYRMSAEEWAAMAKRNGVKRDSACAN
jgi:hypothetical protein